MVDSAECLGFGIGEGCCSIGLMGKLLFLSSLSSVPPKYVPNLLQQTNKQRMGAAFTFGFDQGKARFLGSSD